MHPSIQSLLGDSPVVTDGAWGTQFQSLGLLPGDCPDGWCLTRPEAVESVARAYVEAGSRIILTNTFGANRFTLARHNLSDQAALINQRGVEISRQAAAGRARVFASMGPSGKMLAMEEVTAEELTEAFTEQARAFAKAGADGVVIETMTDLEETKVAVTAVRETGLPVVACMVFDSGKEKDRTLMGVTPEQAAEELIATGADVIGANCGHGIEGYISICRRLQAATDLPIWIKPNAGLPNLVNGQPVYQTTPAEFVRHLPALAQAGATFIGGCCGTTPNHIRAVITQIREHR